jgi:N-acetylglucosaminyldiphosphoundecaprenol N-acetyl-beta-D-mannosaminyltransferase
MRGLDNIVAVPVTTVGGMTIAALDRAKTARLMIDLTHRERGIRPPVLMSSANGEVISRCASDAELRRVMSAMDVVSADGQPLVFASRALCAKKLPERVATTDLFHDVACLAAARGVSFYVLGASAEENERAVKRIRELYPDLKIVGHSHGYLSDEELDLKVEEIDRLAPDIVWVCLGLPREQLFCMRAKGAMKNVGVLKTSGGLLNFISGTRKRAPRWMQLIGLEWAFRLALEPRRLFWRYAITNPHAVYIMITRSR